MIIKKNLLLVLFIIIGFFLHFYNLNWGSPFYFHPDERNIASSVSQLEFPNKMNPNFFAYGSLPIYTIYFTGVIINYFPSITSHLSFQHVTFEQAILISRFYSALFATLLIPILFLIGKRLKDEKTGLITAFLATMSVGFIQFSHFGTFEMWLTFFSVLLFWVCIQKTNYKNILLTGVLFGILISVKISSIVLLLLPILTIFSQKNNNHQHIEKIRLFAHLNMRISGLLDLLKMLKKITIIIVISGILYILTNPFVFLDYQSFRGSIKYESSVVLGTLPVFYTGEFFTTTSVVFQFLKIYPFLLNPLITIIFIFAFIYVCWKSIRTKNQSYTMLIIFYVILFFPQASLFAKWTRYIIPTLPFAFLIVAIGVSDFLQFTKKLFGVKDLVLSTIVLITILFSFSYFITAFVRQDTRVAAKDFAVKNIPSNAQIVSEVYDMGIVPFNNNFSSITLFNFYDLDQFSPGWTEEKLSMQLETTDYIILPSQRIYKTRLINKKRFPKGNSFYERLFSGKLPYVKIYETPCDVFCKITYLGNPVFNFEQTSNVFDRPTVMIFKKI